MNLRTYRLLLAGGGTMGSVTPLLAVALEFKKTVSDCQFLWLGTKNGPEKKLVEKYNIIFKSIPAGKLRRYFSFWNFIDPFFVVAGFLKSLWIIFKFKPHFILSAGGFVAVPVIWAGRLIGVPSLVHQQDVRPGLANKLTAPFAKIVTVVFPESLKYFPKAIVVGNPVRQEIFSGQKERSFEFFNLEKDLPTILVLGGGTGALKLNRVVAKAAADLVNFCQVIHITGGRLDEQSKLAVEKVQKESPRYHLFEFLVEPLKDAYAVSDLVISRAGMGTLTELAVLGKPTILVPIPKTHQEANAWYFKKRNAVYILDQEKLTSADLVTAVKELINNKIERENLSRNIKEIIPIDAAQKMVKEILKVIQK
jgi:UDP-N-acetylglucosamine--N-acetylmuramyl-(pentapeptide) pyrophosphoryl-undecaprenol N-acetylglucosamine transferase